MARLPVVLEKLLIDIRPLRESPAFRRLWAGQGVSSIGSQMAVLAVVLQVFGLTHSSIAVGAVGLCVVVPQLAFALLGGTIGDAVDRRMLVLVATCCQAGVSALFTWQAYAGNRELWVLYALVVLQFTVASLSVPARRALVPRLLQKERIPAGAALNMLAMHFSSITGPALAGVAAAAWGLKVCYLINTLSIGALLYGIARLPSMRSAGGPSRQGLSGVVEGLGFIRGEPVLLGAILADLSLTVFGMPTALLPAINAERFGGSAQTLGILTAAISVGGVLGSVLSGPVGRTSRPGRTMLLASILFGACITGFGFAWNLVLALALLVIAGGFDVVSAVLLTTVLQVVTPDQFRSRVGAAEYLVGMGGPQLGNFRAGAIGSLATPTISAVGGGLAAIAATVLVWRAMPAFVRYHPAAASGSSKAPA